MSVVNYGQASSIVSRMPSPEIWKDCPVIAMAQNPAKGIHIFDDFKNAVVSKETASASDFTSSVGRVESVLDWHVFSESTKLQEVAVQNDADGVLHIAQDGSDQDVTAIITGFNAAETFKLPDSNSELKWWFECRFKTSVIANADMGIFIGFQQLGEAADTKGGFAGDAAALVTSQDFLGFAVLEGDGNDLTIQYLEGGAGTLVKDTGEIALLADTYIRVGFRYDVISNKIRVYKDGVDLGDAASIDVSSSDFPSDTDLALLISVLGASGTTAANIKVDWVRYAQEY